MRWASKSWARLLVFALIFATTVPQLGASSLDASQCRDAVVPLHQGAGAVRAVSPGRNTERSSLAQHVAFGLPAAACCAAPLVVESPYADGAVPQATSTPLSEPSARAPPFVTSFC